MVNFLIIDVSNLRLYAPGGLLCGRGYRGKEEEEEEHRWARGGDSHRPITKNTAPLPE